MPKTFTLQNGASISVADKPLGEGGEGAVYEILSPANFQNSVAKILFQDKRTIERQYKARYMVDNPPSNIQDGNGHNFLIWPQQLLFENNDFAGFVMPKAGGIDLEELCRVKLKPELGSEWQKFYRDNSDSMVLRLILCSNISKAVNALHATGHYVIGDLKPENIRVKSNGLVSILDLDSFQISDSGQVRFQSKMNTPKYNPPDEITERKDLYWDLFILGIIFYEILCGIHPFIGTTKAPYENFNTPEQKIQAGLFPFGSKANYFEVVAPPHYNFKNLPNKVQSLFLKCFDQGITNPAIRPNTNDWIKNLTTKPVIKSFTSNSSTVLSGKSVEIFWEVEDFEVITITGIGNVTGKNSISINPTHSTTYKLIAENAFGKSEEEIKIEVLPLSKIKEFRSKQHKIEFGKSTDLKWDIENAEKVELLCNGNIEVLPQRGEKNIEPQKHTQYKIVVTALDGTTKSEQEVTVKVYSRIKINSFTTNYLFVVASIPVTLNWDIENASEIFLEDNFGNKTDLIGKSEFTEHIKQDTTYRIWCKNDLFSEISVKLHITVIQDKYKAELQNLVPRFEQIVPDIGNAINLDYDFIPAINYETAINIETIDCNLNIDHSDGTVSTSIAKKVAKPKNIKLILDKIKSYIQP